MSQMIAKFYVRAVTPTVTDDTTSTVIQEKLYFSAVSDKPFSAEGASDDNSFARWSPAGSLELVVQNPALIGKFKPGQKFYLEFTEAAS
jgi:hypothetical protein